MSLPEVLERETRSDQRVNMFVLATLSSATTSGAVKVRNMSERGALIEGAALPDPGELVQLCRGEISVQGRVVWNAAGKAGLRFDALISVDQWTPGGHARQRQVDRTFQQIKSGIIPVGQDEKAARILPSDLDALAKDIDGLADALAADPATVVRFGSKLQTSRYRRSGFATNCQIGTAFERKVVSCGRSQ